MKELSRAVKTFLKGADLVLLFLGLAASGFGTVAISSAARPYERSVAGFVQTQLIGIVLGVALFVVITAAELDSLCRFWKWIFAFNILLLLLLIPFGTAEGGNRSWVIIPGLPMGIQPAEVVKVTFTLLLAGQIYYFREKPSGILPVTGYVAHLGFMLGLIYILSGDIGVALIYVAAFIFVLLAAGIKLRWFALGGAAVAAAAPLIWTMVLTDRLRSRILVIFNPNLDPDDVGWQTIKSMSMISSGGFRGQGLYQGAITQTQVQAEGKLQPLMPAQHNDFIFAPIGEELGFLGCAACILLLTAIILRCLWIARRAKNGLGSMVCCGVAGMFIFQTFLNIGMCLGVAPVIGITLPFFSYGGSSVMASFAMLGLVSSVRMHPERTWLDT